MTAAAAEPLPWPDPPLAGGGIVLRPWRADDLQDALAGSRDPEVPRFTNVPADNTMERVAEFHAAQEARRRDGEEIVFAVADAAGDRFLGCVSILRLEWGIGCGEIGYWLAPWGRGRGAMTAAVDLLSAWALRTLALGRIELMADRDNLRSQAVAERAGFTREGVLRARRVRADGTRADLVLFSRLATDL